MIYSSSFTNVEKTTFSTIKELITNKDFDEQETQNKVIEQIVNKEKFIDAVKLLSSIAY